VKHLSAPQRADRTRIFSQEDRKIGRVLWFEKRTAPPAPVAGAASCRTVRTPKFSPSDLPIFL
jgi:hypothetical protein